MAKPLSAKNHFKHLSHQFFPAYVIKHILFTKNPGWENMNAFAFGGNSDFLVSAHQQSDIFGHNLFLFSMVLFPTQDFGDINHLLLPHTIFNLTSKGKETVMY